MVDKIISMSDDWRLNFMTEHIKRYYFSFDISEKDNMYIDKSRSYAFYRFFAEDTGRKIYLKENNMVFEFSAYTDGEARKKLTELLLDNIIDGTPEEKTWYTNVVELVNNIKISDITFAYLASGITE